MMITALLVTQKFAVYSPSVFTVELSTCLLDDVDDDDHDVAASSNWLNFNFICLSRLEE